MHSDLICFPFAGGGKYCYDALKQIAGTRINFITCELPGRGERSMEKLLTEMGSMVGDLVMQAQAKIKGPYAIFGHSMGALLACLVAKEIKRRHLVGPDHLFLTGCGRPAKGLRREQHHKLPKDQFINFIKDLGGVQGDLLENEDFFKYYEPIVRADFQAIETYEWRYSEPLDIDISVIVGTEDSVTEEEAMKWQDETTGEVTVDRLEGDHFFIFDQNFRMIDMISKKMHVNSKDQQSEDSHSINRD